jgi:hypothetical protein
VLSHHDVVLPHGLQAKANPSSPDHTAIVEAGDVNLAKMATLERNGRWERTGGPAEPMLHWPQVLGMSLSVFVRRYAPVAWITLLACGGHRQQPEQDPEQDPVALEAARAEQARASELEQAVLAIESDPPGTLSEGQFYQLLDYYCGACHFPQDYPTEWILTYFNDLQQLVARGKVIPGDAEDSRLVLRMRTHRVSLDTWEGPGIPDTAIDLIADFIDQLPTLPAGGSAASR